MFTARAARLFSLKTLRFLLLSSSLTMETCNDIDDGKEDVKKKEKKQFVISARSISALSEYFSFLPDVFLFSVHEKRHHGNGQFEVLCRTSPDEVCIFTFLTKILIRSCRFKLWMVKSHCRLGTRGNNILCSK